MGNNPLHHTVFIVWWDQAVPNGSLVRQTKEFGTKAEAALFIGKQPHIVRHGAGCYRMTVARTAARDGKVTETTVKEDMWTFAEIREMVGDL